MESRHRNDHSRSNSTRRHRDAEDHQRYYDYYPSDEERKYQKRRSPVNSVGSYEDRYPVNGTYRRQRSREDDIREARYSRNDYYRDEHQSYRDDDGSRNRDYYDDYPRRKSNDYERSRGNERGRDYSYDRHHRREDNNDRDRRHRRVGSDEYSLSRRSPPRRLHEDDSTISRSTIRSIQDVLREGSKFENRPRSVRSETSDREVRPQPLDMARRRSLDASNKLEEYRAYERGHSSSGKKSIKSNHSSSSKQNDLIDRRNSQSRDRRGSVTREKEKSRSRGEDFIDNRKIDEMISKNENRGNKREMVNGEKYRKEFDGRDRFKESREGRESRQLVEDKSGLSGRRKEYPTGPEVEYRHSHHRIDDPHNKHRLSPESRELLGRYEPDDGSYSRGDSLVDDIDFDDRQGYGRERRAYTDARKGSKERYGVRDDEDRNKKRILDDAGEGSSVISELMRSPRATDHRSSSSAAHTLDDQRNDYSENNSELQNSADNESRHSSRIVSIKNGTPSPIGDRMKRVGKGKGENDDSEVDSKDSNREGAGHPNLNDIDHGGGRAHLVGASAAAIASAAADGYDATDVISLESSHDNRYTEEVVGDRPERVVAHETRRISEHGRSPNQEVDYSYGGGVISKVRKFEEHFRESRKSKTSNSDHSRDTQKIPAKLKTISPSSDRRTSSNKEHINDRRNYHESRQGNIDERSRSGFDYREDNVERRRKTSVGSPNYDQSNESYSQSASGSEDHSYYNKSREQHLSHDKHRISGEYNRNRNDMYERRSHSKDKMKDESYMSDSQRNFVTSQKFFDELSQKSKDRYKNTRMYGSRNDSFVTSKGRNGGVTEAIDGNRGIDRYKDNSYASSSTFDERKDSSISASKPTRSLYEEMVSQQLAQTEAAESYAEMITRNLYQEEQRHQRQQQNITHSETPYAAPSPGLISNVSPQPAIAAPVSDTIGMTLEEQRAVAQLCETQGVDAATAEAIFNSANADVVNLQNIQRSRVMEMLQSDACLAAEIQFQQNNEYMLQQHDKVGLIPNESMAVPYATAYPEIINSQVGQYSDFSNPQIANISQPNAAIPLHRREPHQVSFNPTITTTPTALDVGNNVFNFAGIPLSAPTTPASATSFGTGHTSGIDSLAGSVYAMQQHLHSQVQSPHALPSHMDFFNQTQNQHPQPHLPPAPRILYHTTQQQSSNPMLTDPSMINSSASFPAASMGSNPINGSEPMIFAEGLTIAQELSDNVQVDGPEVPVQLPQYQPTDSPLSSTIQKQEKLHHKLQKQQKLLKEQQRELQKQLIAHRDLLSQHLEKQMVIINGKKEDSPPKKSKSSKSNDSHLMKDGIASPGKKAKQGLEKLSLADLSGGIDEDNPMSRWAKDDHDYTQISPRGESAHRTDDLYDSAYQIADENPMGKVVAGNTLNVSSVESDHVHPPLSRGGSEETKQNGKNRADTSSPVPTSAPKTGTGNSSIRDHIFYSEGGGDRNTASRKSAVVRYRNSQSGPSKKFVVGQNLLRALNESYSVSGASATDTSLPEHKSTGDSKKILEQNSGDSKSAGKMKSRSSGSDKIEDAEKDGYLPLKARPQAERKQSFPALDFKKMSYEQSMEVLRSKGMIRLPSDESLLSSPKLGNNDHNTHKPQESTVGRDNNDPFNVYRYDDNIPKNQLTANIGNGAAQGLIRASDEEPIMGSPNSNRMHRMSIDEKDDASASHMSESIGRVSIEIGDRNAGSLAKNNVRESNLSHAKGQQSGDILEGIMPVNISRRGNSVMSNNDDITDDGSKLTSNGSIVQMEDVEKKKHMKRMARAVSGKFKETLGISSKSTKDENKMHILSKNERNDYEVVREEYFVAKVTDFPQVSKAFPTREDVTRQWINVLVAVDDVPGGICIFMVLPSLRKVTVSPSGKERNKVRIEAVRQLDRAEIPNPFRKSGKSFVGEYKLKGLPDLIDKRNISYAYDKDTGLLCVFVDSIQLKMHEQKSRSGSSVRSGSVGSRSIESSSRRSTGRAASTRSFNSASSSARERGGTATMISLLFGRNTRSAASASMKMESIKEGETSS